MRNLHLLGAFGFFVLSATVQASDEAQSYGVRYFNGESSNQCDGFDNHTRHGETADEFAEFFEDLKDDGDWDSISTRKDRYVDGADFTDSSKTSSCACAEYQPDCSCSSTDESDGADKVDVVFIHTHGFSQNPDEDETDGIGKVGFAAGDYDTDCTPTSKGNWLFDDDLDILVVKACQAGNYEVFMAGGFYEMRTSSSQFRMYNSFHGNSSCTDAAIRHVRNYAQDSEENGVGDNWIDIMYDNNGDDNEDDCPTSAVFGESDSKRDSMYEYGGWKDRKDTGSKSYSAIYYIGGCNPEGSKLPE